jgi:restriction system protein
MPTKYFYEQFISNSYLGKSKTVKAQSKYELNQKIQNQLRIWEEQELRGREKDRIGDLKNKSDYLTKAATNKINSYNTILINSVRSSNKFNWNSQKDKSQFKNFTYLIAPPSIDEFYIKLNVPRQSFMENFIKSKKIKREQLEADAQRLFNESLDKYNKDKELSKENYEKEKNEFLKKQNDHNSSIDSWKQNFENCEKDAVERYIKTILDNLKFPDDFEYDSEVQYMQQNKILIVSFKLPSPENIPNIIEYKYIKTRDEMTEKVMKKTDFEKFYDDIIYQSTLKVIHEILNSSKPDYIDLLVFNGWVDYIDKATGQDASSCIISVEINPEEFKNIDLTKVDYKECIKSLKGIFSGKLINLSPVKPILNISTEDNRFIESKDVLSELTSKDNLASMPWEDFEHLVRQLFEKMFNASSGAEVKVTQASRDGGVDAIAFDPDPIKGGKFIIQAKRYNNVVSVSSVRDLYGTMIHEGATKGILVTTSYFGKDSYEFVKDKPISLIDGQNLLSLFNQYGYSNLNIKLMK